MGGGKIVDGTLLRLLLIAFICETMAQNAAALDLRQKKYLESMGERTVVASIHYHYPDIDDLVNTIQKPAILFSFIETLYFKAPASTVLGLAKHQNVRNIEIIDETIGQDVYNILTEISRLYLYHRIGAFRFGVLNASIGAPISLPVARTGRETIGRAYRAVVEGLDVPLVTTAGNNGAMPGLFNPWANTRGVIVAAAATEDGLSIGDFSGRPIQYNPSSEFHFFAAHGIDTIGPRASRSPKTKQMLEAERRLNLAERIGPETPKGTESILERVTPQLILLERFVLPIK